MSEQQLSDFKGYITDIKNDAEGGIWTRRRSYDDMRFCRWEGQSDDGRKHKDAAGGKARQSLGSPRIRSPMILRWMFGVPPPITVP